MPTIEVNGSHQLAYFKSGHGPAVIVVHGIGGHKEDWQDFALALASDYTVYAVDMLGFGESSKHGDAITVAEQADAIAALLESEHVEKADLVGNSVGGWVAATFAANYPDKAKKLVLVDAAGFKAMFEGAPPVDFYPKTTDAMANLLAHVRHDAAANTPEAVEAALASSMASGDDAAAEAVGKGMYMSERLEDVTDRVQAPTLVIWGAEDKLFPSGIADLVAGHSRAQKTVILQGASHFPQLDKPAEFTRAVTDFLKG